MSIDRWLSEIEAIEADGAIVLIRVMLKWDGERQKNRRTVVITRSDTDYVYRRDTDDLAQTLQEAIADYRGAHPDSAP